MDISSDPLGSPSPPSLRPYRDANQDGDRNDLVTDPTLRIEATSLRPGSQPRWDEPWEMGQSTRKRSSRPSNSGRSEDVTLIGDHLVRVGERGWLVTPPRAEFGSGSSGFVSKRKQQLIFPSHLASLFTPFPDTPPPRISYFIIKSPLLVATPATPYLAPERETRLEPGVFF